MDKNSLIVLRSDLTTQMALIETTFGRLEERAADFDANDFWQLESVAYQIHNIYNAVEDLLEIVAAHFENHIADKARWHTMLLQRMAVAIEGLRPRFLSEETFSLLDGLRGFRHFFRHAYAASIDPAQLEINLAKARQLRSKLSADIEHFLDQLN